MMRTWLILSVVMVLAEAGCGASAPTEATDPPVPVAVREEAAAQSASASESTPPAEATEATISGFTFKVPAGWRRAELTAAQQGFVDARFEIPKHGDEVKLTLSTISGGVQANIDRWIGQFQLTDGSAPETESVEVDGVPVTLVDLRGEFQGMGQDPQAGWRMLGAAFDGDPRDFYIKLTGPEGALDELHEEFRAFVMSAKR
jgi:hypothetical protein